MMSPNAATPTTPKESSTPTTTTMTPNPLNSTPSSKASSLSSAAAQMKEISDRMAAFVQETNITLTKAELDTCSDPETLRKRCINLHREKEMLKIQLDISALQRALDSERHARREDEILDTAKDRSRIELCRQITDTLQSEFACSICNEVFLQPTVTNCGHTFCNYCILEWTHDKRNCPICRKWIHDSPNLQKHVEMDNFVGKLYAFLGGEVQEARSTLIRDRVEVSRLAVARREAEVRDIPSISSRYNHSFLTNLPLERRRRLERYMQEDRPAGGGSGGVSPATDILSPTLTSAGDHSWHYIRTRPGNIVGASPITTSSADHPIASIRSGSIAAINAGGGIASGNSSAAAPTTPSEDSTVQRELYRRLVYMESDRFQNMPRPYQQHILRTLYGDRGDSSILTDPSVMNAMLASRPRIAAEPPTSSSSPTPGNGSSGGCSQVIVPVLGRSVISSAPDSVTSTATTTPRYLSMLRRLQETNRYRNSRSARSRLGLDREGGSAERERAERDRDGHRPYHRHYGPQAQRAMDAVSHAMSRDLCRRQRALAAGRDILDFTTTGPTGNGCSGSVNSNSNPTNTESNVAVVVGVPERGASGGSSGNENESDEVVLLDWNGNGGGSAMGATTGNGGGSGGNQEPQVEPPSSGGRRSSPSNYSPSSPVYDPPRSPQVANLAELEQMDESDMDIWSLSRD